MPTGPLTNIALALRAAPDLAGRIAGISLMGGGTFGNRTAAAEFNLWCDPEAADIVFSYGGPLIMSGLDLTHQFQAMPERIEHGARAARAAGRACSPTCSTSSAAPTVSRHHHIVGAPVHDPCAVMALTHPHLFTRTLAHVEIETQRPPHRRHDRHRPARPEGSARRRTATGSPASTPTPAGR